MIAVREDMLKAGSEAASAPYVSTRELAERVIRAALQVQADKPPVPTDEQIAAIEKKLIREGAVDVLVHKVLMLADYTSEWVRIMHDKPDVPEGLSRALWNVHNEESAEGGFRIHRGLGEIHNKQIMEAYELGRKESK